MKNGLYEVRHRHGLDWPYVTAAVAYRDSGGAAADARVVLGHVAPVPWRVDAAGEALSGAAISADTAAKAGEAATVGATPLSRNAYKAALVKTAVKRAALTAAGLPLEG
ncbi:MAG: hypothetical protein HYV26_05045 [Candidatus Hydrogenedentes bacterium]|nr:hypothetical protein [Candidatus Hydrogenedentota bacterium]